MFVSGAGPGRFALAILVGVMSTACSDLASEVATGMGSSTGPNNASTGPNLTTTADSTTDTSAGAGSGASASGGLDDTVGSTTTSSTDSTSSSTGSDQSSSSSDTGAELCVSVSVTGGQQLTAPADPSLVIEGSTAATLEGWFLADAGAQGQIVGSRASSLPGWSIRYTMGGTLTLEMRAAGGGAGSTLTSTALAEDVWHHFAFVRSDAFVDAWMLYVDGQEALASVNGPAQDVASDYEFILGAFPPFENQQFSGLLGPMALSNTDRYVAPFAPSVILVDDGDTIASWPFDEGAGPTVQDIVGDNDFTLDGATWVETGPACP